MEIREKKTKSGNKWRLVNEYWETYYAWGHKTTLIRNGYDYGGHKVRYYNRTWECYTYQTCMRCAVERLYQDELNRYINHYKYLNDINRFKKGEKKKLEEEFASSELAQDLKELKECIKDRSKFD